MRTVVFLLCVACFLPAAAGQSKTKAKKPAAKPVVTEPELPSMPRDRPMEVGDVGTLYGRRAKIISIVDPDNMLVEAWWEETVFRNINNRAVRDFKEHAALVWLQTPTAGLVDGRLWHSATVFNVVGTKTYETALGRKTVLHLKPADVAVAGKPAADKPAEGVPATVKPAAGGAGDPKLTAAGDTRSKWLNKSYDSTIALVKDKQWAEIDNKTKEVRFRLTETGRTADYVEVVNEARKQSLRIYPARMELLKDGKWEWVANGSWQD